MLFLLNHRVLDLGDVGATLRACGGDPRSVPATRKVIALGQDAAYATAGFTNGHNDLAVSIACMLSLAMQANCALFVCPAHARSPRDVLVQFAFAPLTTLAYLADVQTRAELGPALVNAHVWRLAGRAPAA